ncbi:MAG: TetR/AcrR family transcriptional regulator [Acidobacteria bacterium]|nr:TetR/AcrR family transcriptional regulator [Acidobacteriota bacterium]
MSKQTITPARSFAPVVAASRMAGEERRLQILLVAISLFAQKGFRGTTTKEIAQAAGVSEAMVFRHFATKDELYSAILDHKACAGGDLDFCEGESVADAISRKDDRAVFERLAYEVLEHHEHDTEFLRLLMFAALEGHELAQMFWERNVLQVYEFLSAYLRERQREGALREVDPRIIVRAFVGMVMHHAVSNNLWDTQRRSLDITNEQAAREFTEILLKGIASADVAHSDKAQRTASVQRVAAKKKQKK